MSDQKPDASASPPTMPRRASAAADRAAVSRRRWLIGGLVLLVVVGTILLVRVEDGSLGSLSGTDARRETPAFAFDVRKTSAEPTTETPPARLRSTAKAASDEVKATLDALYFSGFIDQETWGVLDDVERLFEGSARDQAEADLDVLTLGADADTYEFVDPEHGQLTVKILANSSDEPVMAIASVKFKATAEDENGVFTSIVSKGSYYLQPSGGVWRIIAYRVERGDELADAPAESVGGSISPEATS